MANKMMTVADVTDADLAIYSDMYKECYNVRPCFTPTKEDFVRLSNQYDDIQAEHAQEELWHLEHLRHEHSVNFADMTAYYEWNEAQYELKCAAKVEAKALQAAINKVGSLQIIDQWEHGLI